MKKSILSLLSVCALTLSVQAQNSTFDPTNAREGETVEYCVTHKKDAALLLNPAAVQSFAQDEIIRQQEAQNGTDGAKATTYYIPIVFHLLENGGSENISDEQIIDAFNILNIDFDLLNPDANNVHNDFNASNALATAIPTDVDVQFRLATKAPDGTCFSGITHTTSSQTSSGSGSGQVNAIRNGNDVYQGEWAGDKYLNVFICKDLGGAAGYTYTPSNWVGSGMDNGIWILHQYLGSIGTGSSYTSRALTHEVGHWLNLPHPWGGTNNPGLASNCSDDDGVSDTPNTVGSTSCNLNENTCGPRANVENFMDYSYCSKMFTPGQVNRMRTAINSNIANRDNVISAANLIATGADGNLYLCTAQFSAPKTTICVGESIQFSDESFNVVNGWTWTFAGGSPASSTDQNPMITYTTPGLYAVTLSATDGSSSDLETKTNYIRVLPEGAILPFLETFESYSTLTGTSWEVENPGNNAGFEITSATGHTGIKSVKLANYGQGAGNVDELISSPVDLSGITSATGVTLSFRFSYKKIVAGNNEYLKIFITNDCGDSWVQRKTIFGNNLSPDATASVWTPSSQADWTTVHMTNVTSSYWVDNLRYKFRFESDGGNNFYLDNINIYGDSPSDDLVLGIEENGVDAELNVYPNPTDGDLNVKFTIANAQNVQMTIQDVTGKIVQANNISANTGSNLVMMDTQTLSTGVYFLNVQINGASQTIRFIVK